MRILSVLICTCLTTAHALGASTDDEAAKAAVAVELAKLSLKKTEKTKQTGCPCQTATGGRGTCGMVDCPANGGVGGCPCINGKLPDIRQPTPDGYQWQKIGNGPWKLVKIGAPVVASARPFPVDPTGRDITVPTVGSTIPTHGSNKDADLNPEPIFIGIAGSTGTINECANGQCQSYTPRRTLLRRW